VLVRDEAPSDPELLELRDLIGEAQGVLELGAFEAPTPEVFGQIGAVALVGDTLFVADDQASEIQVFGPSGDLLQSVGRAGDGPGEFVALAGLVVLPNGDLLIMSHRSQLQLMSRDDEGVFQEVRRLQLPNLAFTGHGRPGGGGCLLNGELYVGTWVLTDEVGSHQVHVIDVATLEWVRSFGDPPYWSDTGLVNAIISDGYLVCDPVHDQVIFAGRGLPYIQALDAKSGAVNWTGYFDDVQPARVLEYVDTRSVGLEVGGIIMWNVAATPTGQIIVQWGDRSIPGGPLKFVTYGLSGADGSGGLLFEEMSEIVAISDTRFASLRYGPWPIIGVHDFR